MYVQKIFTLDEASKVVKNRQVCKNNMTRLVHARLVKRLRNNLYFIMPLDNPAFEPDMIHIATKLRDDAVICCNSALQVHGMIKDDIKNVFLYSKSPSKVRIATVNYKIIASKHNFGISNIAYKTPYMAIDIKVTDIERTIIDCLRTRSLKVDELIPILKNPKIQLDASRIINYLDKYKKPILYNKTGLVLEASKFYNKLSDEDLDKIRKKLSKKIFYSKEKGIKLIRPRYKYNAKWNIMIPENVYEMVKT